MSKTALQDIQRSLNAIRDTVSAEGAKTQMAALQLLLGTSESIVQLARKMAREEQKTKTRTQKIAIPQTKVVKQQAATQNDANDTDGREKRDTAPTTPQAPLTPQQQREQ
ncbi:hypothetical protein [Spiribacter roseus]|uniref:hypothetical protein n=1 Tax=Spiribacter roseus TaxID=1855875 RepID=UPI001330E07C|nr:hypothetical protein [Spiribacter roseus]KAF0281251.1 hypothetical protein BA900_05700 [Spiribacter roseus]